MKDTDIVMPMYKLTRYSDKYSNFYLENCGNITEIS